MNELLCRSNRINFEYNCTERPDPAKFERHCHTKYELLCVLRGSGKFIVEGTEYPFTSGAVFLLRPFEYHYMRPSSNCVYERYVSNFDEEILMGAVRALPFLNAKSYGVFFSKENAGDNFCNVMERVSLLFEGSTENSPESEAMSIALINQLLLLLSYEKPKQTEAGGNELIGEIIEYLNLHLSEKISLDETAKCFFISKYYLCRLFRKHTGVTVLSYLTSKRIAMAQHMIRSGEPPTSVAYAVGFRDYSSFYRAYIKETGMAPSEQTSDHG